VKAFGEALVGLAFLAFPSMTVSLLTGEGIAEPGGVLFGRLAGVTLLAFGISCWLARQESQSRAAIGLVWALLFYDFAAVPIFLSVHFGMGLLGIALWPAVALHSGLGVWSVFCLRKAIQGASLG
jgi:hypothetical protein